MARDPFHCCIRLMVVGLATLVAACAGATAGGSAPAAAAGECRWPVAPVILRQAADTLYQTWTFDAREMPERVTVSRLPALAVYLDTVRSRTGSLDARAQLNRQIGYYAAQPDSASQGEAANGRMVLDGSVGTVRAANCLEALLIEYQAVRFPMASHPTEFQAVLMEREEGGRRMVRVYFAGSGAPWPPKANLLLDGVAADRRAGWRAVAHLHNHPFLFAGPGDIAGANAPSMTDVQFWRHLRESYGHRKRARHHRLCDLRGPRRRLRSPACAGRVNHHRTHELMPL